MQWLLSLWPVVSIALTVHVLATNRPLYWVLLIWLVPVIGPVVYFFAEILPDLRRGRSVSRFGSELAAVVQPGRQVRLLEEELEVSDTVKNRQLLARAYVEARRYREAIHMYRSCLKGVYEDDPPILLALAEAQFLDEAFAEALETVRRLKTVDGHFRPMERRLLTGRILEALGELEDALAEYEALANQYPGEEARCRYALLLQRTGQDAKAHEVFERILLSAKRSPRYYRKAQKEWIHTARQKVKG